MGATIPDNERPPMAPETSLIATIVVCLVFAFVGGFVASKLKLPPLVGYLLAGVAVGPFTPGFVADETAGGSACGDRRHPVDVRGRPPLLDQGPAGGARYRRSRRAGADHGGDSARRWRSAPVGLVTRAGCKWKKGMKEAPFC